MNKFHSTLCLLAVLAAPVSAQVKVFGGVEDRKCARVFYYSQPDGKFKPEGQISLDYGQPEWKKEYEEKEAFDKMTRGRKWRFGTGPWTRLDTNVALSVGDEKIAPGNYYLVLQRTKDDKIHLIVVDPATVRAKKMDAFQAEACDGKHLPMEWTQDSASTAKMSIELTTAKDDPSKVTMLVRFGPHNLKLGMQAHVGSKN